MKPINGTYGYVLNNGTILNFPSSNAPTVLAECTTNEELIEVLIHRITTLDEKLPCIENAAALSHLQGALRWLKERAERQQSQAPIQTFTNTEVSHTS
jgi:hypothetical protein